jgi:hypothetical protein
VPVFDVVGRKGRWSSPSSTLFSQNLLKTTRKLELDFHHHKISLKIVHFCSGISNFHAEFHIDFCSTLTQDDSDGEQEHAPVQANDASLLFAARP